MKVKMIITKASRYIWLAAIVFVALLTVFLFTGSRYDYLQSIFAESFPSNDILLAKVLSVQEASTTLANSPGWTDALTIQFITGNVRGMQTVIHNTGLDSADPAEKVHNGETIVVAKSTEQGGDAYYMADRYRLPALLFLALIFILAIMIFGGMRGLTSLLGLLASMAILLLFVVPEILHGADPLTISLIGAIIIAIVSLYLAHGFNKRTTIALAGTLITLCIAVGLTIVFTGTTHLLGIATEESAYLKIDVTSIDLHGLLLGGIIIGMLGVLDDVTIGQVSTIEEIKDANNELDFKELYRRGASVGKEHIASLVNTLVLAYAGVSFPLFLLTIVQAQSGTVPLWLAVNGEPIAEEVVRTLVGSLALVFAVPITTALAAYWYGKSPKRSAR